MRQKKYEYDLVLSFAGEERRLVERLYKILTQNDIRVFYDKAEQAELWGKDLYQHLQAIYRDKARFCVVFVSQNYLRKRWTRHELRQAQERAFKESLEYILPIQLDDACLPGLNMTTGYIQYRRGALPTIASLLLNKLGGGKLDSEDVDRLGWDGRYVNRHGQQMVSYWPKQIRKAQKIKELTYLQTKKRMKYGEEGADWGFDSGRPCHDCSVIKGEYHVLGCDVERCPSCGNQLISCDCVYEYEEE